MIEEFISGGTIRGTEIENKDQYNWKEKKTEFAPEKYCFKM